MIRFRALSLWLFIALVCIATLNRVVNSYAATEVEKASKTHSAVQARLKMHRDFVLALFHVQRGQRGYFLTGNESYLDPYYYGIEHIPLMFQELKAGSVVYGTNGLFEQIEKPLADYLKGMDDTLTQFRQGNVAGALAKVRTNEEKHLMDSIQGLLSQAEAIKRGYLKETEESLAETLSFQRTSETITFLILFFVGITLLWQVKTKLLGAINALRVHLASLDGNLVVMQRQLPERDMDDLRVELNSLIRRVWGKEQEVLAVREREIQAAKDYARRQEEFNSVLAHELRTPLNTLIGTIDCEKVEGNWKVDEAHARIEMVAANLLELVNSSLDYQRMSLGHYEVSSETFSIRQLLVDLEREFREMARSRQIQMAVCCKSVQTELLSGDVTKIKQVLMNLVSNAMKFTPAGGRVSLVAAFNSGCLQVQVVDSGIGIAPDRLDLIFEPFQQADSGIKRKYGGTGIGLTLCKKIAECLGGRLWVESALGQGSTFTFESPCCQVMEVPAPEEPAIPSERLNLQGFVVLMVEDHQLNAKINKKLLEKNFGCTVLHVETGEAALALADSGQSFDLVLMDVNLGAGLSGLETTLLLQDKLENCPPILALTAGVTAAQRQAVIQCGMSDLLEKPFSLENANLVLARHCKPKELVEV